MKKNIFYRDFTICKAVALVVLMGLAAALGGVPSNRVAETRPELSEARIIPAMVYQFWDECDREKVGVDL
ncbi:MULTISPECIES: hypothetical protein [Mameliella]|uniref:Uncharacterized protein n=1 Tax=Mameliella alba TaxID=561184 RepID=A0A0B3SU99_9RHOB|nr:MULTISPECIES: hypothetical protein [Mameliella]MBV6635201.1 hypothetical protein [Mameliella sp.]MCR9272068.1 hypothetical protein [Paracoccaceae bacterium]ODM49168.1 hypothetical protein A9320_16575 [Ruegeria sp. PBVC088]KHQ54039.1 hypothetical protein OA50_01267 [Mameliella alba]MBY6119758.1 hypothetical protein [Mameliella alba]